MADWEYRFWKKGISRRKFLTSLGALFLSIPFARHAFSKTPDEPAVVYFTDDISPSGMKKILPKVKDPLKGRIGIKLHFGEEGNKNFISPELVKPAAEALKATLVETNVLYVSKRRHTESHIQLAKEHGSDFAPIDILDSTGDKFIPAKTKHFSEVRIGKHFDNYDSFLVLSHFKGHMLSGFGGAIKNIAMGFASVSGKMAMHASTIPRTAPDKCILCGQCVKECPGNAITLQPVRVDPSKCIGCGKCIGVCPVQVYNVPWSSTAGSVVVERLCEYAKVISSRRPMAYINVLAKISQDCDCMSGAHAPFVGDIGILASHDIVALEQACLDLVNKKSGGKDAFLKVNNVSGKPKIRYAESIGLGTSSYRLMDIG